MFVFQGVYPYPLTCIMMTIVYRACISVHVHAIIVVFHGYIFLVTGFMRIKDSPGLLRWHWGPLLLTFIKKHEDRFSFSFNYVKQDEVRKKMSQFNVKKSTGYDHIPGKILRLAHNASANPFIFGMNACIENSKFTSEMKYAELSPLFKKTDNLLKENNKPVSILTAISKIHDDLMNDQLCAYFEDIFEGLLSAFWKKYSCQSLLTKLIDDWKISLDSNQIVGAVVMDLSNAFDCLPHYLIIVKLYAYGLCLDACKFLSSYLSGRHQRVKIQNDRSNWKLISKVYHNGTFLELYYSI